MDTDTATPVEQAVGEDIRETLTHFTARMEKLRAKVRSGAESRESGAEEAKRLDATVTGYLHRTLSAWHKDGIIALTDQIRIRRAQRASKDTIISGVIRRVRDEWPGYRESFDDIVRWHSMEVSQEHYLEMADRWLRKMAALDLPEPDSNFGIYRTAEATVRFYGQQYVQLRTGPDAVERDDALRAIGTAALDHLLNGDRTSESMTRQLNFSEVYPFALNEIARKDVVKATLGALQYGEFDVAVHVPYNSRLTGWSMGDW
jgi:hypothetical protein